MINQKNENPIFSSILLYQIIELIIDSNHQFKSMTQNNQSIISVTDDTNPDDTNPDDTDMSEDIGHGHIYAYNATAGLLNDNDYDKENILVRDLVNNKEQRYQVKKNDYMILETLSMFGCDIDKIVSIIKNSQTIALNQYIIDSKLTKDQIIFMLSKKYDPILSPDGKKSRSEDVQRLVELYKHNIRLTDLGCYFEKIKDPAEDLEPKFGRTLDLDQIFKTFQSKDSVTRRSRCKRNDPYIYQRFY